MGLVLRLISFTGLSFTVIPGFLLWYGHINRDVHFQLMFAGMILWFVTAPFWMNKKQ